MYIEQYIKERIEELRRWNKYGEPVIENPHAISELEALLSKIEELRQEEIADARGESIFNDRD